MNVYEKQCPSKYEQPVQPNRLVVYQDGEADDIGALAIVALSIYGINSPEQVTVFNSFGNPKIRYMKGDFPKEKNKKRTFIDQEIRKRTKVAQEIFPYGFEKKVTCSPGATSNEEECRNYIGEILKDRPRKKVIILHTASFKSLVSAFERAEEGQFSEKEFLTYASVNANWVIKNEEKFREFFENITKTKAKFYYAERFPLLGKGSINYKDTPLTAELLCVLNGSCGKKLVELIDDSNIKVRSGQLEKIIRCIRCVLKLEDLEKNDHQKIIEQLKDLLVLCGENIDRFQLETNIDELENQFLKILSDKMDTFFFEDKHKDVICILTKISNIIERYEGKVLEKEKDINIKRHINIYINTSAKGNSIIADQILGIIYSEILEGRKNGLKSLFKPSKFIGVNQHNQPLFKKSSDSLLYYANMDEFVVEKYKLKSSDLIPEYKKEEVKKYLKYIDFCISIAKLCNSSMISFQKRRELIRGDFGRKFFKTAEELETMGFDLPLSYKDIKPKSLIRT